MNAHRHINPEDLALFALQFLTRDQNRQVREHLSQCSLCSGELAEIQGDLAVVASTAELHSPPALARERVLQSIAREPRTRQMPAAADAVSPARSVASIAPRPLEPLAQRTGSAIAPPAFGMSAAERAAAERAADDRAADDRSAAKRFLSDRSADSRPFAAEPRSLLRRRILPWTGWAVAAGLAFMLSQSSRDRASLRNEIGSVNHQIATVTTQSNDARRLLDTINDPAAQRVTLTLSKQAPVPQGKATYVPSRGALVFVANNMEPLEPAKVYELWIIPTGGAEPLPAGTFHPDAGGNASVLLPRLPVGVTAKAFGITVEDEGGSQTPTMPIIMAGAAGA